MLRLRSKSSQHEPALPPARQEYRLRGGRRLRARWADAPPSIREQRESALPLSHGVASPQERGAATQASEKPCSRTPAAPDAPTGVWILFARSEQDSAQAQPYQGLSAPTATQPAPCASTYSRTRLGEERTSPPCGCQREPWISDRTLDSSRIRIAIPASPFHENLPMRISAEYIGYR